MSNQTVNSAETIYVLNKNYQYEPANESVTTNAKWLDTANVVSVKRDKTIYAIRAPIDFDFNGNNNQQFFANDQTGISNLYRNFGSNTQQSILMSDPAPVYGNINAKETGLAGSLQNGFILSASVNGAINVDSNVRVTSVAANIKSQLGNNIQMNGNIKTRLANGFGNVDGNTCGKTLQLTSNVSAPVWNRLINANINGSTLVNCSTDPCDINGAAIPFNTADLTGNAISNEAYREQVAVKSNVDASSNINNPVYIARVSQFGTNLSGTAGFVDNIKLHSFTGNFFSNLSADNVLYANGNVMTSLTITGNVNNPALSLFNSNVLLNGNVLNGINLSNVPDVAADLNNVVSVTMNSLVNYAELDTLSNGGSVVDTNGNLVSTGGSFNVNEKIMIVQGNISVNPSYLIDRLSPSNQTGFVIASNIFSNSVSDSRESVTGNIQTEDLQYYSISSNLQSGSNVTESSAKYLYITGTSIKQNNWEITSNAVANVSVPDPVGIPDQARYLTGNIINVYVKKGNVGLSNNTPYPNKNNSGVWVKSIPSFMDTFNEPTGNVYLDISVFGNTGLTTANINVGNTSNPVNITANLVDNYNFYFFGNTSADSRTDKRSGNVVANVNSVMANLWSYDSAGNVNATASTTWNPMIVYGNVSPSSDPSVVRPMSLSNPFSNVNMDYKVEFPHYVGKTTAPSSGDYSFFANIGKDGLVGNATASSVNQFNLDNNGALNDILLDDVVFTTFTVESNTYKYTDIGNVMSKDSTNSSFNAVLPFAGNATTQSSGGAGYALDDVAMNILVDYFQNPVLLSGSADDVHRLTIYDIQYRYSISNVLRSGAAPLNTKLTIGTNGSGDLITNLMAQNGNIFSAINTNLVAPEFTLFAYDNVSQYTAADVLYPFVDVSSLDTERWFPGFNYRQNAYYSSKTDAEVDFTIDNNTLVEQNVSFLFQNINTISKTVSVAKSSDNAFKSIPIRKIRLGAVNSTSPLYGYIVIKVLGEVSSYVVMLYKLNTAGTNYADTVLGYLPVVVNVKSIEMSQNTNPPNLPSNSKNQVEYKSALRVYKSSNNLDQSFTNTVNSHKSPLSLFDYSSIYGSNDCSIGVNTYAAPPSNAVMQWAFKQSVISQLVTYSVVNSVLNGMSTYKQIPLQTGGGFLFAKTRLNQTALAVNDANPFLPKIPALSKRCYLDAGFGFGVYVDIVNTYILVKPIVFDIDRSVEWVLKRKTRTQSTDSYEVVGRGLLSHVRNPTTSYEKRDYLIFENDITKTSSGFQMTVNTNVIDLSARLLAQSISTGPLMNGASNELALNLSTKVDKLAMLIYKVNPKSNVEDLSPYAAPYTFDADSGNVDLAYLITSNVNTKGQLPSFRLSAVRGYQYGEIYPTINRTNVLFSINYARDNYAIVQLYQDVKSHLLPSFGGVLENKDTITFSRSNSLNNQLSCQQLNVIFNNVANKGTLNDNFASLVDTGDFYRYVSYKHNGFGRVSYGFVDYTSNYGNTLPTQEVTSGSVTPRFVFNNNVAYNVSTPAELTVRDVNIKYDNVNRKYYFPISLYNQTTQTDLLYFRGLGPNSLPVKLNDGNTVLLYTGTRPIVVSTLTMAEGATLTHVRDNVAKVGNAMFNTSTWFQYTSPNIVKQTYAVFFTNVNAAAGRLTTNVRSLTISPTSRYFSNAGNFYLGSYINTSNILTNNYVNVTYTNGSYKYPFNISKQVLMINPVQSDDDIINRFDTNLYTTYVCNNQELKEIFKIVQLTTLSKQSYSVTINPASIKIYEAVDANNNGEIDITKAENVPLDFGLDAAFSELLYTLTPVTISTKLGVPVFVDSWELDGNFHNIKGSSLDINMNVKWNIGYNLSNFFTIRQNNAAIFDVITIHTEHNSAANGKNLTNLVVSPTAQLVVGTKNSWAHSPTPVTGGALSGLTFKVNGNKITAGDTVRLFVDNQVSNMNTLTFKVGGVGVKTYKLSSYDQDRYAALLDEQIRFTNIIE